MDFDDMHSTFGDDSDQHTVDSFDNGCNGNIYLDDSGCTHMSQVAAMIANHYCCTSTLDEGYSNSSVFDDSSGYIEYIIPVSSNRLQKANFPRIPRFALRDKPPVVFTEYEEPINDCMTQVSCKNCGHSRSALKMYLGKSILICRKCGCTDFEYVIEEQVSTSTHVPENEVFTAVDDNDPMTQISCKQCGSCRSALKA